MKETTNKWERMLKVHLPPPEADAKPEKKLEAECEHLVMSSWIVKQACGRIAVPESWLYPCLELGEQYFAHSAWPFAELSNKLALTPCADSIATDPTSIVLLNEALNIVS